MTRAWIPLALLAALPASGQVGFTALYTEFQHRPAPAVVEALQAEVESLLAPDGLRFEWRSLPMTDNQVWMELAVVSFKGRCDVPPLPHNSSFEPRLGWTHITDGVVLPFSDVDCDAVRAYVQKALFALPAQSRETVFGRAIGRVMAHELLHVFARTKSHSSQGVDRPSLTVSELTTDHLTLADREPQFRILRPASLRASNTGEGSPRAGQVNWAHEGCASCHGANGEGTRRGPILRITGHILSSVVLAAKLTKSQKKMLQEARSLKVAKPSISEEELSDLASFLNGVN